MDPFNLRRLGRRRHLDASPGREIVFCHQCRNEWYNDDYPGLDCPQCGSGASEIVTDDYDPRETYEFPALRFPINRPPPPVPPPGHDDSDPEEADIDSFSRDNPGNRDTHRNRASEDVLSRFTEMLMNDWGGAARPPNPRGFSPLFPPTATGEQAGGQSPGENTNPFWPGTVQRTTIRSGPDGTTRLTILSSSSVTTGSGANFGGGFPTLLGQMMGASFGGESANRGDNAGPAGVGPRPPGPNFEGGFQGGLQGGLQALLASLLNPGAAVHGDAVYSQEALDRIITSLMEANPQSNAAPPATDDAIDRLEKKKVDEKMLGAEGKAECTICMDELSKGDEVTVLPCSHWFHGECVTLWLKQHNTCPICRAAIEQRNQRQPQTADPANPFFPPPQQTQQRDQRTADPAIFTPFQPRQNYDQPPTVESARASFPFGASTSFMAGGPARPRPRQTHSSRSERENQERLNSIRNAGNSDAFRSNNPFHSRRDSHSPPSRSDSAGNVRQRDHATGSSSGGQDGRDSHSPQSSSGGPFNWFRNHFGHGSGSGSDRDRDRGR